MLPAVLLPGQPPGQDLGPAAVSRQHEQPGQEGTGDVHLSGERLGVTVYIEGR